MRRLNFNHLLYLWTVAKEGGLKQASEKLHLTPQTLSSQLRALESQCGGSLFDRSARRLRLTSLGETVFGYADEIFQISDELNETLRGHEKIGPTRFNVGISDVVSKLICYQLLRPAMESRDKLRLICHEGGFNELLTQLSLHKLDIVITDSPVHPAMKFRLYSHLLGECGISFFAAPSLLQRNKTPFPAILGKLPVLMPAADTALSRALKRWFEDRKLPLNIAGEFDDSALLNVFGQHGCGVFCAPTAIAEDIITQQNVKRIGQIDDIKERFYAISAERRVSHPAVNTLIATAQRGLFQPKK